MGSGPIQHKKTVKMRLYNVGDISEDSENNFFLSLLPLSIKKKDSEG